MEIRPATTLAGPTTCTLQSSVPSRRLIETEYCWGRSAKDSSTALRTEGSTGTFRLKWIRATEALGSRDSITRETKSARAPERSSAQRRDPALHVRGGHAQQRLETLAVHGAPVRPGIQRGQVADEVALHAEEREARTGGCREIDEVRRGWPQAAHHLDVSPRLLGEAIQSIEAREVERQAVVAGKPYGDARSFVVRTRCGQRGHARVGHFEGGGDDADQPPQGVSRAPERAGAVIAQRKRARHRGTTGAPASWSPQKRGTSAMISIPICRLRRPSTAAFATRGV